MLQTASKTDIANVSPTFQVITKSGGKASDVVHAQKVPHQWDLQFSPMLLAMLEVMSNLKNELDGNYFSIYHFNVSIHGKILFVLIQYMLVKVWMMMVDLHTLTNVIKKFTASSWWYTNIVNQSDYFISMSQCSNQGKYEYPNYKLPQDQVKCEAIYLTVDNKYARNICDPIVLQTKCPDAPICCLDDLL